MNAPKAEKKAVKEKSTKLPCDECARVSGGNRTDREGDTVGMAGGRQNTAAGGAAGIYTMNGGSQTVFAGGVATVAAMSGGRQSVDARDAGSVR